MTEYTLFVDHLTFKMLAVRHVVTSSAIIVTVKTTFQIFFEHLRFEVL